MADRNVDMRPRLNPRSALVILTVLTILSEINAFINPKTTLQCHLRKYQFRAYKPYRTREGRILPCYDDVTVLSCWGRCDSSEIADFKIPYKISHHPVCTYKERKTRKVKLRKCHPKHPDPTYTVFDAVECSCRTCNSAYTSCENLNG